MIRLCIRKPDNPVRIQGNESVRIQENESVRFFSNLESGRKSKNPVPDPIFVMGDLYQNCSTKFDF